MIQLADIERIANAYLQTTDCYLVGVDISDDNLIEVLIDNRQGVDIDTCAALSRYIESNLDRDIEDYELTVGSVGLTEPFRVRQQYEKNLGNEIEVLTADGRKLRGRLTDVADDTFEIEWEEMVRQEGKKRRERTVRQERLKYEAVKYAKYLLKV